ncbi:hypothetical protein Tco_0051177 [Tanacetum coccineum]
MLWEWRGIANLAFIRLGWVSRVDDGVLQGRSMGAKQGAGWFWYWREVWEKGWSRVAYKLELPQDLSRVHNTFHVSNLKKCYSDDPLVIPLEGLQVDDKLHFVEEPVEVHWIAKVHTNEAKP